MYVSFPIYHTWDSKHTSCKDAAHSVLGSGEGFFKVILGWFRSTSGPFYYDGLEAWSVYTCLGIHDSK